MGNDALMINQDDSKTHWVHKVKDHGLITAVAGLGMINLWDFDEGSCNISEYLDFSDGYAK